MLTILKTPTYINLEIPKNPATTLYQKKPPDLTSRNNLSSFLQSYKSHERKINSPVSLESHVSVDTPMSTVII